MNTKFSKETKDALVRASNAYGYLNKKSRLDHQD